MARPWALLIRRPSSLPPKVCPPRAKTRRGTMLFKREKGPESNCASWHKVGPFFLPLFHCTQGQFLIKWVCSENHRRTHFYESHVDLSEKRASIFLTNANIQRELNIHHCCENGFQIRVCEMSFCL